MAEAARLLVRIGAEVKPLEQALRQVQKDVRGFSASLDSARQVGIGMVAMGGALAGALGFAAKAAAEEEVADKRLIATLKNVGLSWGAVEGDVRRFLSAQERLTGFNDTDLQQSLSTLVSMTGDLASSYRLTALAADVARGANLDLSTAAMLVGRAATGNTELLGRYGIELRKGATATEALEELNRRFGGSAKEHMTGAVGAWQDFRNQLDNVIEGFGAALLPVITPVFRGLANVLSVVTELPAPLRTIVSVTTGATAALALFGGGLLLLLGQVPKIVAGFHTMVAALQALLSVVKGLSVATLTNPWVLLAAALALAGVAVDHVAFEGKGLAAITETLRNLVKGLFGDVEDLAGPQGLGALKGALGDTRDTEKQVAEATKAMDAAVDLARARFHFFGDDVERAKTSLQAAETAFDAFIKAGLTPADTRVQALAAAIRDIKAAIDEIEAEVPSGPRAPREVTEGGFATSFNPTFTNEDTWDVTAAERWFGIVGSNLEHFQAMSAQTFQAFSQGLGDAIGQAIVFGEDFGTAMKQLFKNVAATIISALIQIGVQRVIQATLFAALNLKENVGRMAALTQQTYAGAFAATAAIPVVGPIIAPAVAAAATATMLAGSAGAAAAGAGAGASVGGAAHGGLENVPDDTTFFLKRGERVIAPEQNRDLGTFLDLALGRLRGGVAGGPLDARPIHLHAHLHVRDHEFGEAVVEITPDLIRRALAPGVA